MKYTVTIDGKVINEKGKEIKPYLSKHGYLRISIYEDSKYKRVFLHRLIAEKFIPNINNLPCVNHIDGDKKNNNISNLEWCSYSHNNKHAYRIGLNKRKPGEKSHRHVLKENQVKYIYINPDGKTNKELADIYNVATQTISNIWSMRTWVDYTKDLRPLWRSCKNGKGVYAVFE
jgi:hypothetical protein